MNVSSSQGRGLSGRVFLRRLFLLSASLTIGTVVWFLLGDSDGLGAEEKLLPAAHAATPPPPEVIAHVDGVAITEEDVLFAVADELAVLEEQRQQLLQSALETRISRQLIESEAFARGTTVEELLALEVDAKVDRVDPAQLESSVGEGTPPEAAFERRRQLRLQAFIDELRTAAAVSVYGEPAD